MKFNILIFSFLGFLILFLSAIGWSSYRYYTMIQSDDPVEPSLTVMSGGAKIIRGDDAIILSEGEHYILAVDDIVETDADAIANILWPDHSVTRLGGSTRIIIHTMLARKGYQDIEISFSLKKGKIWSNVVRAMIGDSYFETRLPKNNIIAGVRGTVYEINLDHRYIRAIEHGVNLRDQSGKSILALPGELIDSDNIWIRRGREFLDTSWETFNSLSDTQLLLDRAQTVDLALSKNTNILMQKYDQLIRWVLSFFDTFEVLTLQDLIALGDEQSLMGYSSGTLGSYYQRILALRETPALDTLRSSIVAKSLESGSGMQDILDTLRTGAIWEYLTSETLLPGAKRLIQMPILDISKGIDTLGKIPSREYLIGELQRSFARGLEAVQ